MVPGFHSIESVRKETGDTVTISWKSESGDSAFRPGQFNMLYLRGIGEVPISISGDPSRPGQVLHTIRAVGAVSSAMTRLRKGDRIGARGPYGNHWPVEETAGSDIVLIAGGIGLAPLRPALYAVLAQRARYGKVVLLYGARSPEGLLFRKELEDWRGRFDLEVRVTVDHAQTGWLGDVGVVSSHIARASFDPGSAAAMICGPEVMMRFAAMELLQRGMAMEDIHVSLERNMKCGIGLCGHCQLGPKFVCKDGPVFSYDRVQGWLAKGEI